MTRPRVSVVLPFFNARETLTAAVHSILGQTFHDWELIQAGASTRVNYAVRARSC